jgi:hypothetical protein
MKKFSEAKAKQNQMRKKMPGDINTTPEKEKDNAMEIEGKIIRSLKYSELPEEIIFYLTEIYPFGHRLFISGIMQNGQTLNLVATEPQKEIYFALRKEYSETNVLSPAFLSKAKQEINQCLHRAGISQFTGEF